MDSIPKISVLVITFNQENVIRRTIESILSQKKYIYEICVSDDCSTDNTFSILQELAEDNPGIFKLHKNNPNQGIFHNIETVWSMASGDIMYVLAGDDLCGENYFKEVVELIKSKELDYENDAFCIYGDYKEVTPSGLEKLYKNDLINKGIPAIRLKYRKLISSRSACFSKATLRRFKSVANGRDFSVELIQDDEIQIFSDLNYYIPICGNIYYSGIGISSRLKGEVGYNNTQKGYSLRLSKAKEWNADIKKSDIAFLKYLLACLKFFNNRKISHAFKMMYWYLRSIDLTFGMRGLQLGKILFSIKKKI